LGGSLYVWQVSACAAVVCLTTFGAVRVSRALSDSSNASLSAASAFDDAEVQVIAAMNMPRVSRSADVRQASFDPGLGERREPEDSGVSRWKPIPIRIEVAAIGDEYAAPQSNVFRSDAPSEGVIAGVLQSVPAGTRLSAGFEVSPGTWVIPREQLGRLAVTLPLGLPGPRTASLHLLRSDGDLAPYASIALRLQEPVRLAALLQAVPSSRPASRSRPAGWEGAGPGEAAPVRAVSLPGTLVPISQATLKTASVATSSIVAASPPRPAQRQSKSRPPRPEKQMRVRPTIAGTNRGAAGLRPGDATREILANMKSTAVSAPPRRRAPQAAQRSAASRPSATPEFWGSLYSMIGNGSTVGQRAASRASN
jgi:hypothetical protein